MMRGVHFSSLRTRLFFLVLLTILPALGLVVYDGLERRRLTAAATQEEALRLARLITANQEEIIYETRQLFVTIAQFVQFQDGDLALCSDILASLDIQYPRYTSIFLTDPEGDVLCSSTPLTQPLSFSDRSWLHRAVRTGDFTVGDYQIGRISGKAIIVLAYPILDSTGSVRFVLTTGLDLAWLNQFAVDVQLPAGSTFAMIDRNGIVLARYPDPEKWVGKAVPEAPIVKSIQEKKAEGTAEAFGVDGIKRLYAFTRLEDEIGSDSLYVVVGIPAAQAYIEANWGVARNIFLLGIVFVISLTLAWIGSEIFLLRQINELSAVTKRLARGDLGARSKLASKRGEVGQLASAFNDMAEELEERESQLRQAEANYRSLFNRVPVGLYRSTPEGQILDANPALVELLGFPDYDALLNTNTAELHADHEARGQEVSLLVQNNIVRGFELQLRRYDGTLIWVRDTVRTVLNAGGQVLYYEGNLEDITERRRAEESLRELATRDELTGLYNRREMMRLLAEEVERFQRHRRPVSLALLDIDHFKLINDTYGHPVGDEVLRSFSQLVLAQVRSLDRAARYGGEEFAIIMPETTQDKAFILVERMRQILAGHAFAVKQVNGCQLNITLTVTIGVGEISPRVGTKDTFIEAVDRVLYKGKRQGRNCTVCVRDKNE
jgi:diguanylate cyclase (GGDEF)-like protein/PAS domain S-box-containing protein